MDRTGLIQVIYRQCLNENGPNLINICVKIEHKMEYGGHLVNLL